MSLVEAAAALDRLLQGHREEGAALNLPPSYTPSQAPALSLSAPDDDGNLLPALFPNTHTAKDTHTSSTPAELPSIILPWNNLPAITLENEPFPVTPLIPSHSPLLSPIPLEATTTTLQALPSPLYPPHWVASLDQRPSIEDDIMGMDALPKSPRSENTRRRRRRRRSTRGEVEDLESLDDFVPLDPEKYKTELCRSFQVYSYCRCNYAHGLQELRGASRHGKYKTRNCQSYHETGFCRYGARCSFIHDPEEGVLKCSIANKEVLEALHYRPSIDDSPRTANITWRFLESLGEPAPELHFISSTSPSQELGTNCLVASAHSSQDSTSPSTSSFLPHINLLISSEEDVFDESRALAYSIPIGNDNNVLSSTRLLQENLNLLLSLQVGDESSKSETLKVSQLELNSSLSLLDTMVADQAQNSRSCGGLCLKTSLSESACVFPWPISPLMSPRIQELSDDDEEEDNDCITVKPAIGSLPTDDICQKLRDLEVVHTILQRGPLYSATVWSDGTDFRPATPTTDAATEPKESPINDLESNTEHSLEGEGRKNKLKETGEKKCKNRNVHRRKRRPWQKRSSNDSDNHQLSKDEQMESLQDEVFSSTLQSDLESDDEGKVSTGAAGPDGDEWSEKSSLHLADLLRSLRLREGNNQLLPWSKSGRRYSSDGSSIGLLSPKDRSSPSSPASPRQHDMTKYKTELCRSFQYNGYCGYGDACLYAHGPMDLRSYPKHPMYRTKQCFSFHNKGFCLYGSRCQFLHDLES